MYDLFQCIFVSGFLYTALPFRGAYFSNIMLLPLYRSLPCCGIRSCRVAGEVLNSDGSDSRAAISRRSIKE